MSIWEWLPVELRQVVASAAGTFAMAFLGRLLYHVEQVKLKRRNFWSLHLVWETMTALCIFFAAEGVAQYLGLTGKPAMAVVVVISYLGPRGLESIVIRILERYAGKQGGAQ